jgi:hypothetical protein
MYELRQRYCYSYLVSLSRIKIGCFMLPGSSRSACCASAVITPELCGEIHPLAEIVNPKLKLMTV